MDYRDNPKIKPSNIDNERRCGEYARISAGVHTVLEGFRKSGAGGLVLSSS
jgi:hypothetical protein